MEQHILWVDDEIDLLKPHILFLEQKGYRVSTSNNGDDAIDIVAEEHFDIVFLDENMPGLSGLETLTKIKNIQPNLPVVMITKSEEESIMEDAIGGNIADYLIKPVNPKQILLSLKKNLENKSLISQKTTSAYQQEFRHLGMEIGNHLDYDQWTELYKRLVLWELKLEKSDDASMNEIFRMQKEEANTMFMKYIQKNYQRWLQEEDRPAMSHTVLKDKLFPILEQNNGKPLFFILIDNMRYDLWKVFQPIIENYFRVQSDEQFYSILPTATHYARNSIFAGLMPLEIAKKYPKWWKTEIEEGSKNNYEKELLQELLKRYGKKKSVSYHKVLNLDFGKNLANNMHSLMRTDLNVIVYNFVDMLSHARTEMEMIKELAQDDAAYRSLTLSWFEHSPLFDMVKFIAEKGADLVITTDHGAIKVENPVKVIGDKFTNSNLRYKMGKSLNYKQKDVFAVRNPEDIYLPKENISSSIIFAHPTDFFAYPNNFNYYAKYYKNTFQHGGVSMEEMLIPFIHLRAK